MQVEVDEDPAEAKQEGDDKAEVISFASCSKIWTDYLRSAQFFSINSRKFCVAAYLLLVCDDVTEEEEDKESC